MHAEARKAADRHGCVRCRRRLVGEGLVSYHAWYDMPLETRKDVKKALDKLKGEEKENAEHHVASAACHTADGYLAAAQFGTERLLRSENASGITLTLIYALATVTGNALITRGELAHAVEPLRQSSAAGPEPHARLALGVVYACSRATGRQRRS